MFPFFETIRYQQGKAENLFFHQQRVERTFHHYGGACKLDLLGFDFKTEAEKRGAMEPRIYKCKFLYDLNGQNSISFEPYSIRAIKTFTFFEIGNQDYSFKFSDRSWINTAVKSVTTDELVFVQDGILKDTSYANLVLFDGKNWVTPSNPLLLGTRRALLLSENKIFEKIIHLDDLKQFQSLKLINAMMHWEESPTISLKE